MNDVQFDGYIDKIQLNGKTYALKCTIVETHPPYLSTMRYLI